MVRTARGLERIREMPGASVSMSHCFIKCCVSFIPLHDKGSQTRRLESTLVDKHIILQVRRPAWRGWVLCSLLQAEIREWPGLCSFLQILEKNQLRGSCSLLATFHSLWLEILDPCSLADTQLGVALSSRRLPAFLCQKEASPFQAPGQANQARSFAT